jgi:hypothetical protein
MFWRLSSIPVISWIAALDERTEQHAPKGSQKSQRFAKKHSESRRSRDEFNSNQTSNSIVQARNAAASRISLTTGVKEPNV